MQTGNINHRCGQVRLSGFIYCAVGRRCSRITRRRRRRRERATTVCLCRAASGRHVRRALRPTGRHRHDASLRPVISPRHDTASARRRCGGGGQTPPPPHLDAAAASAPEMPVIVKHLRAFIPFSVPLCSRQYVTADPRGLKTTFPSRPTRVAFVSFVSFLIVFIHQQAIDKLNKKY